MRVALVRPNYDSHLITPLLGLGYIASYLNKKGHDVLFLDALNQNLDDYKILKELEGYDVVGMSVLTAYFLPAKILTDKLKQEKKTVIWGGVHPTVAPEQTFKETKADYLVIGEGEISFEELLSCIEKKKDCNNIKGVMSRSSKRFRERELIEDLDVLPFPLWEQMDPRKYKKAPHGAMIKKFPVAPITTTRGCPYECTFCVSPGFWKRKIRFRSPENVIAEIEYLVSNFGVKEIHFEDDNLTLKRSHIEKICNLIISRRIRVSWATPNGIRADKVDMELLRLMKKSGCYYVAFGIESANQEILDKIKKHEKLEEIERAIRLASKAGIMTQGFFILGLPGETEKTIKKTISFAKSMPLDRAQFLLLDILPGSELWETYKKEIKQDYSKKSFQDVKWVPGTISETALKNAQPEAFRQFFLRPRPVLSMIKYVKPYQVGYLLKRIKDFRIL